MSLQDLFYIVAIIVMCIHIITLVIIVVVLIAIQKKVSETAESVERRVENVKHYITHPDITVSALGNFFWGQALTKISKLLRR
jgi:hypothetical protein